MVTLMQTLKQRAVVTGLCAGALTATGIVVFMTVPLRERLTYGLMAGAQQGWFTYVGLSAPLPAGARRAAVLAVAGAVAIWLVSVPFWFLV